MSLLGCVPLRWRQSVNRTALEDHYTILDVSRTASKQEIEAAWRRAVKMWHPDRNDSTDAKFRLQSINTARNALIDDVTRRKYDRAQGYTRTRTSTGRMKRPVRTGDQSQGEHGRDDDCGDASGHEHIAREAGAPVHEGC